jgi:hypothetical protein
MKTNELKLLIVGILLVFSCNSEKMQKRDCIELQSSTQVNKAFLLGAKVESGTSADEIKVLFPGYIPLKDPQYEDTNDTTNFRLLVKEKLDYQDEEIFSNRLFVFERNRLNHIEYEFYFSKPDTVMINSFLEKEDLSFLKGHVDYNLCYTFSHDKVIYEVAKEKVKLTNGINTIGYRIISKW